MHIYEYLFAAVIIVVMLTSSITMVSVISQPSQDAADKGLLKTTADKIMSQILFDPGYPYNWGYDGSTPIGFGLAKFGLTSREVYLLDPDKVQRLNSQTGDFYIHPKTVINCLNLGTDYGFTIKIAEVLKLGIAQTDQSRAVFDLVATSTANMLPVINANISAALYSLDEGSIIKRAELTTSTGYVGNSTLDFKCSSSVYDVLIISVDYLGLHLIRVEPVGSNARSAYLIGDTVQSTDSYTLISAAATEVIVTQQHDAWAISDFTAPILNQEATLMLKDKPEASTVALLTSVRAQDGTPILLVGYREFEISYRSIPAIESGSFSYSIERKASIGGTTCSITLFLWRMSV